MVDIFKVSSQKAYKIAEIGGNHEGSFESAVRLTELAAECNIDGIKFQVYTGDTLVNKRLDPSRNAHFKKFELTTDQYIELARLCKGYGVDFLASIWNEDLFDIFAPLMPFLKIGSGDATCFGLIERLMSYQKPIVISTGLCTSEDVDEIVGFVDSVDKSFRSKGLLCLMQCTSMYPIPDSEANLSVIDTYKKRYAIPVGYSDHTVGSKALEIALCKGVDMIEFHFTDKREGRAFRDHKVSLLPDEVIALNEFEDELITLLGSSEKSPTESERSSGHVYSFRRSVYAKHKIDKGSIITSSDLVSLRPAVDNSAKLYGQLLGSTATDNIESLESILGKTDLSKDIS